MIPTVSYYAESLEINIGSIGTLALLSLVLSTILGSSTLVPTTLGYLITAGVFGLICLWIVLTGRYHLTAPKPALVLYSVVIALFLVSSIWNLSLGGLVRLVAFSVLTTIVIFSLVHMVEFKTFWRWFASVTAILVVLGVPTLFVEEFSLGPISITAWSSTPTGSFDIGVNTITSLFSNPNSLALVCCFAIVGVVTTQRFSRLTIALIALNALGVFAADGQAAQLGTITGVGIFAIGRVCKRSTVVVVTTTAIGGIIAVMLMMFQFIPGLEAVATLDLNGRRDLWTATARASQRHPYLGYGLGNAPGALAPYLPNPKYVGLGPHNSYLRMALNGGVVAAVSYIGLHVYALHQTAKQPLGDAMAALAVLWAAVVIQLFNGTSIFGLSLGSIMFALALGWALREISVTGSN